jgi:hypothetical protein
MQVVADAVLEDKVRHAHPLGIVTATCPRCQKSLQMNCYRIAEGPFGTRKALHVLCPSCDGIWSMHPDDQERILAGMTPVDRRR